MTDEKRSFTQIDPAAATGMRLPNPEVQGPYNELGDECPWPWDPIQLKGAPIGQYHCPYCGAMVIAGMDHLDYGPHDERGMSTSDYSYREYVAEELIKDGLTDDEIRARVGDWWRRDESRDEKVRKPS